MPERIDVRDISCTRLMRPEFVCVLSQKMIVVALVNNNGDFRGIFGAFRSEIADNNGRVISYDTCNEIRTRLGIRIRKPPVSGCFSRLVKGDITVLLLTPS